MPRRRFPYRAERFAAMGDTTGKLFAFRARRKASELPSSPWDGVTTLEEK